MKIAAVVREDYTLYLEDDQGFYFIHCDCRRWTKTVRKNMAVDLEKIQKSDIYAIHDAADDKHAKFLKIFGFAFLQDFAGLDGQPRQIYVRRA